MTMNVGATLMAQKLRVAEEKVAEKRGGFHLFGLFEHEQAPGRWDLVASAPWLKTDREGTLELVALLRAGMDTGDWTPVVGVFPIEPSADYVQWATSHYDFKHQVKEVFASGFGNEAVGHALLITADRSPASATLPLAAA